MVKFKAWLCLMLISVTVGIIVSCNKDNNDAPTAVGAMGEVAYFNLVPNADAINFYVNGTRLNSFKIAYGEYSGYLNVIAGQQALLFKTDSLRSELFPTTPFNITTGASTLFVTGKINSAGAVITRDTATVDTGNYRPKLRFVNTSANAPALDVVLNSVSITNQAYKSISKFARVDTGKVVVKLNLAGTNNTVIQNIVPLQAYHVYTLFVYGSYLGTGNTRLSLGVIANL